MHEETNPSATTKHNILTTKNKEVETWEVLIM